MQSHPVGKPEELLSAKGWALRRIRAAIHSGELRPGDKIAIDGTAQSLGLSRTPVRDALWQLANEGLVTVSPRVGAFVRGVTNQEAADIFQIKGAVEPLMAAWAAERGSAVDRYRFHEQVTELGRVAQQGDVELYVDRLERCREALLSLAGSSPLEDILGAIDGRVRLLRFTNLREPGRLEISAAAHLSVAEAIRRGDSAEAFAAMSQHVKEIASRMRDTLYEEVGPGHGTVESATASSGDGPPT